MIKVDTRGMLCPAPLIATKRAIKEAGAGANMEVVTDNETAMMNLKNYISELGAEYTVMPEDNIWKISFASPLITEKSLSAESFCATSSSDYVVVLKSDKMGEGDPELGEILMRAYLNTLSEEQTLPSFIILYNKGVMTSLKGKDTACALEELENRGVTIVVCGTCIDYYGIKESVSVGVISNMYKISSILSNAGHVIYP